VSITAVGGSGSSNVASDGTLVAAGGKGARVTATVPLPAGTTTLYVEVGAPSVKGWPGFNGGGGSDAGHEGGDASDVRLCSKAACPFFAPNLSNLPCGPTCVWELPDPSLGILGDRLVVAGGGGGAGSCVGATGGQAGDTAATGAGVGGTDCVSGGNAGFGGTAGGAGGAHSVSGPYFNGLGGLGGNQNGGNDNVCDTPFVATVAGTLKIAVQTVVLDPACLKLKIGKPGGGGGGWYGGGNGGISTASTPGGGGAGSSWWYPGATNTSMAIDTSGTTSVTISYTPTPVTVSVSGSYVSGMPRALFTYTTNPADVTLTGTLSCTRVGEPNKYDLAINTYLNLPGGYTLNGRTCSGLSAPSGYLITSYQGVPSGFMVSNPLPGQVEGARVQQAGTPEIYLIDDAGSKRGIPDPTTYYNLFRDWNGIQQVADVSGIPSGPDITSGAYLAIAQETMQTVYLVDNGQKRGVTSPAVMDKFYFNYGTIRPVPQSTLDALPTGFPIN
jgi:hypothetical protein